MHQHGYWRTSWLTNKLEQLPRWTILPPLQKSWPKYGTYSSWKVLQELQVSWDEMWYFEPTNRARGSKPSIGRSHLSHGICSLHSQVTGKLMGILERSVLLNVQNWSRCLTDNLGSEYLTHKTMGWSNGRLIQCQDRKVFKRKHKHIYTHILIISNSPFWNVLSLPFTTAKMKEW